MPQPQTAATCRWAVPTLFMAAPTWTDADDRPWTCVRELAPRELDSTDVCQVCAHWEPRSANRATPNDEAVQPYFLDILGN